MSCLIYARLCKQTTNNVHTQFVHGMNTQRSNTATRIRRHCISIFGVDESSVLQSEIRREKFRNRIGWVVDPKGNGSYSSVDVEILHKGYSGEYNPASVFLSPILMGVSGLLCFHLVLHDLKIVLAFHCRHPWTNYCKGIYARHHIEPEDGNHGFHPQSLQHHSWGYCINRNSCKFFVTLYNFN